MKAKNSVFTFCTLVLVFLIMLTLIAFVRGRVYRQDKAQTSEEETSSSKPSYGFDGEPDYFESYLAKGVYDSNGFKDLKPTGTAETGVSE